MKSMKAALRRFSDDERGATAVEYALMGTFIFLVIIAAVQALGNNTAAIFNRVAANIV